MSEKEYILFFDSEKNRCIVIVCTNREYMAFEILQFEN